MPLTRTREAKNASSLAEPKNLVELDGICCPKQCDAYGGFLAMDGFNRGNPRGLPIALRKAIVTFEVPLHSTDRPRRRARGSVGSDRATRPGDAHVDRVTRWSKKMLLNLNVKKLPETRSQFCSVNVS